MSANDLRLCIFVLVIFFLFTGDPNVWDRLHEMALNWGKQC
jgi:hypothetical protein